MAWKDLRWKKEVAFCLIDPSKSASNSTIGAGIGEGVLYPPLVPGRLFSVFRIRASHFLAGPLSSVPKTLTALRGTISWNLSPRKCKNIIMNSKLFSWLKNMMTLYIIPKLPKNIDIRRWRNVKPIFQT